ncbi:MAG: hypothetical protein HQK49_01010 [Oligoflexia bacterium]|nr:hypothetical protein [Oligoflexia bacterium]
MLHAKKTISLLLSLSFILLFSSIFFSCTPEQHFANLLNKYDHSGYSYSVVKSNANDPTMTGQRWIVVSATLYGTVTTEDGHTSTIPTERKFIAYNITNYTEGMNFNDFVSTLPSNGIRTDLQAVGGNLYRDTFTGNLFEESSVSKKDLEKIGAFNQQLIVSKIAENLSSEFGLSEERGEKIAKLVYQWNSLSKQRNMTDADLSTIGKEILGFDMKKCKDAILNSSRGDNNLLNELINSAASKNKISPEHVNQILNSII